MNAPALVRSWPASAARGWPGRSALAAVALLIGGWWALQSLSDPWPARATLKTPGDTWPLAFSPDGRTFLTSDEGGVTPWDVATGRKREAWSIPYDRPASLGAYSPDGRTFAARVSVHHGTSSIELIDATTGRTRASLDLGNPVVYALAFTDEGRTLRAFLGGLSVLYEVVTWDIETGQLLSRRPLSAPTKRGIMTFSSDGRTLAIGRMQSLTVELWDLDADRSLGSVKNPDSTSLVNWGGVGLDANGRTLAIAREDGSVELWDVPTLSLRRTLMGLPQGFTASGLRFSPDGRTLAMDAGYRPTSPLGQIIDDYRRWLLRGKREDDSEVFVLDLATGRTIARAARALHPHYSPDGRTIATRELDFSVKLRDLPGPAK